MLRASAGWRPFTDHGLEIFGGYTLVTLGGSTTEGDVSPYLTTYVKTPLLGLSAAYRF